MLTGNHLVNLTRSEFAAVRAYVQGMPAAMVVARYLSDDGDDDDGATESALRTLLGLRDRMVQLAHLHGRLDLAELLELGPGRSNRGMDRLVEALAELERLGMALPRADHGVELWFAPALARRLRAADIGTLRGLVAVANRRGTGWWRAVPRIGALAAKVINKWLFENRPHVKDEDGAPLLGAHVGNLKALAPAALSPKLAQLVPLERMSVESTDSADPLKSAITGTYEEGVLWVRRWLSSVSADNSPTWLAYRKEAERLLLWSAVVQGKPLLSLTAEDLGTFSDFLADPAPVNRWCGPRASRESAAWRPFSGPLGETSRRHSLRVLGALFSWIDAQGLGNGVSPRKNWVRFDESGDVKVPLASDVEGNPLAESNPATRLDDATVAPFIDWLRERGSAVDGMRYRAAEAAVRLMRAANFGMAELASATWKNLEIPDAALGTLLLRSLHNHWQDRGLAIARNGGPVGKDVGAIPLLAPPAPPPTGHARRKATTAPHAGYSVRGLHALLSTVLARYRESCDPHFPARTPRELRPALSLSGDRATVQGEPFAAD